MSKTNRARAQGSPVRYIKTAVRAFDGVLLGPFTCRKQAMMQRPLGAERARMQGITTSSQLAEKKEETGNWQTSLPPFSAPFSSLLFSFLFFLSLL
jgi:hypothetical protein